MACIRQNITERDHPNQGGPDKGPIGDLEISCTDVGEPKGDDVRKAQEKEIAGAVADELLAWHHAQ